METISSTEPKAQKIYKCDWCGLDIRKGEKHQSTVIKHETIYNWRNHIRCSEIACKLDMFDYCEDGLSKEAFQETISDEYASIKAIDFEDLPSFGVQLNAVCAEYLN